MAQNNQLTCEFHTFYSPISNQMYFKLTHSARSLIIKMIRAQMELIFIFGMNEYENPKKKKQFRCTPMEFCQYIQN